MSTPSSKQSGGRTPDRRRTGDEGALGGEGAHAGARPRDLRDVPVAGGELDGARLWASRDDDPVRRLEADEKGPGGREVRGVRQGMGSGDGVADAGSRGAGG